jgi:ABC-type glutathione transport system ATPase component
MSVMLRVTDLVKTFASGRSLLRGSERSVAVDGVSFEIEEGSSFGLVGESPAASSSRASICSHSGAATWSAPDGRSRWSSRTRSLP